MAGTYTIKSFDQTRADMIAYLLANSPQITDLSPGSIIRSFLEAAALSIEELSVETYLGFQRALLTVGPDKFNFPMKTGTYAQGNVQFSAATAPAQVIIIPVGTRIQTSAGLVFDTTIQGSIAVGQTTSGTVSVQAEEVGAIYNVSGSSTLTMLTDVNGVTGVIWYSSIGPSGGTDSESQFQYQARFQAFIEGLAGSNIAGLKAAALSVSGVTSASVVEEIPPVSNVNAYLYIDNGSQTGASSSLVSQVQGVINGDGTTTNPGYRSAGVNVVVVAATIVAIDIAATVIPTSTSLSTSVLQSDVITAVTNYVNSQGTGDNIVYYEVVTSIMNVYGVANIQAGTLLVNGGTSDITITGGQVGRLNTIAINIG